MKKDYHSGSRLNFDFPPEIHKHLKATAAQLGVSMREFATQAILEKLRAFEDQRDIEAYDRGMESVKNNGTISIDEMKKRLGL